MSGGYFDGQQYVLDQIVDQIQDVIYKNDVTELNDWGDIIGHGFSEQTITELKKAVLLIKGAEIFATRIDWLLSGDDGEETFHTRLAEDLANELGDLNIKLD